MMLKLDDIYMNTVYNTGPKGMVFGINLANDIVYQALKEQIKKLMLELIGENESRPLTGPQRNGIEQDLRRTRNKLRNEIRQKIEEVYAETR